MAFITGLLLIDAQASALNNLGNIPGARNDNSVGVKVIHTKEGQYPYVSAQAYRYWLRTTLQDAVPGWQAAPIYRENKVAYTDADPIKWWDDDLFGYMRAPSRRESARSQREADAPDLTETTDTVTRISPFRVSTLVSIAPASPVNDFGVMARHEGAPVPFEHQFYRATLKGLFSLDLKAAGTFWYCQKTGYRNLDDGRVAEAQQQGLQHLEKEKAYRLATADRIARITALFDGLAVLNGGAKQTLHYTDVTSPFVLLAVTKGGNHIFNYCIGTNSRNLPEFKTAAFQEALSVFAGDIISDVYVGWTTGYLDGEREKFAAACAALPNVNVRVSHPRETFRQFCEDLTAHPAWLE